MNLAENIYYGLVDIGKGVSSVVYVLTTIASIAILFSIPFVLYKQRLLGNIDLPSSLDAWLFGIILSSLIYFMGWLWYALAHKYDIFAGFYGLDFLSSIFF